LGPVFAQLGRLLGARAGRLKPPRRAASPLPRDPEFLPDCATPTPDQAQEKRYGLGRRHSDAQGRDR
jgi:hypothetical protein